MKILLLSFFTILFLISCNKPFEMEDHSVFEDFANAALKQQGKYYLPNYEYVYRSVVDKQSKIVVEITVVYDEHGVATVSSSIVPMKEDDVVVLYHLNAWQDFLYQFPRMLELDYKIMSNKDKLWLIPFENPTCILFDETDIAFFSSYTVYSTPKKYGETIVRLLGYDKKLSCHSCLLDEDTRRSMREILTSSEVIQGGGLIIKAEDVVFQP